MLGRMSTTGPRKHGKPGVRLRLAIAAVATTALGSAMLAQESEQGSALGSLGAIGAEMAEGALSTFDALDATARRRLAPLLSEWIAEFRDDALDRGVERIPADIRETLSDFVPADVLDDVRWRIDGERGLVGPSLFAMSSAYAVTLDNVIVFAGADEAADANLWAHEIYHVMQYREWGIEDFVLRYLDDHGAVEHEAKEFQYRWWEATQWNQEP
jgi:hypothetical protein